METLTTSKQRHSTEVEAIIFQYQSITTQKSQVEADKENKKNAVNSLAQHTLIKYQNTINKHLAAFGAGFTIVKIKGGFTAGTPSSSYCMSINNETFTLSPSSDSPQPHFGNTLSSSDKNTLAFAFFIAKLEDDPQLSQKIIVVDDPMSSFDDYRQTCTKQEICKVAENAKQTILLSHNPLFLHSVWQDFRHLKKSLKIERRANSSVILEWDITLHSRNEYEIQCHRLLKYVNYGSDINSKLVDIARLLRPILEYHLRYKHPISTLQNHSLGDMLSLIRNAEPSSLLKTDEHTLSELESINNYSKQFHHHQPIEPGDDELRSFATRTLKLTRCMQ